MDSARAVYLLETLKSRGVTWPDLWWKPEIDGGVCSFLGTVDETFDAHGTLTILEAKEEEERLQASAAEIDDRWAKIAPKLGRLPTKEETIAMVEELRATGRIRRPPSFAPQSSSPGEGSSSNDGRPDREPAVVGRAEENMMAALALALDPNVGPSKGDVGPSKGSEQKISRQEKRAEARRDQKAKAKYGKK